MCWGQTSQIPKDTNSETHCVHVKLCYWWYPYPYLCFIISFLTLKTKTFFAIKQLV